MTSAPEARPAGFERDPTAGERRVLELAYREYQAHGRWVSGPRLEGLLRNEADDELTNLLTNMPRGLLWPDPSVNPAIHEDQAIALTVFGLSFVPDARWELNVFVRVLKWAAETRYRWVPPIEGQRYQTVPVTEVLEA